MFHRIVPALIFLVLTAAASRAQTQTETQSREDALRDLMLSGSGGTEPAPATSPLLEAPVDPATYRVGPGDRLRVQVVGKAVLDFNVVVDPEGWMALTNLGSLSVAGRTLTEAREQVRDYLKTRLRDAQVDVRLVEMRRFKVYVLGNVVAPGAYAMTAAARASEAITAAGGSTGNASLRTIRVRREGQADPLPVDLVPFLYAGDARGNPFLADGDRIVVGSHEDYFSVSGEVDHSGVWDLPAGETLRSALAWIGLRPEADSTRALLARFRPPSSGEPGDRFDTLTVALDRVLRGEEVLPLVSGDRIYVRRLPRFHEGFFVRVEGEVSYPGEYPITLGADRVRDVLARAGGLRPEAVSSRVTLVRAPLPEVPVNAEAGAARAATPPPLSDLTPGQQVERRLRTSADAERTTLDAVSGENPLLANGDRIVVPRSTGLVQVAGEVGNPGLYPHREGWSASEYLRAAGGTTGRADRGSTRLVRGREGTSTEASRAPAIEPGDILFVPDKQRRTTWDLAKEFISVAAQVATIYLVIDQATK